MAYGHCLESSKHSYSIWICVRPNLNQLGRSLANFQSQARVLRIIVRFCDKRSVDRRRAAVNAKLIALVVDSERLSVCLELKIQPSYHLV